VHYCVTNIPGAVGRTSTFALTNATTPYALQIADKGIENAAADNVAIMRGINVFDGHVTNKAVADTHGLTCREF